MQPAAENKSWPQFVTRKPAPRFKTDVTRNELLRAGAKLDVEAGGRHFVGDRERVLDRNLRHDYEPDLALGDEIDEEKPNARELRHQRVRFGNRAFPREDADDLSRLVSENWVRAGRLTAAESESAATFRDAQSRTQIQN